MSAQPTHRSRSLVLVAGSLLLAACGGTGSDGPAASTDDAAAPAAPAASAVGASFPLTVDNCGVEVTFDAPPQRVALLNSAALPALDAIGVTDRIVARAGAFPPEYYDDDLNAALEDITSLGGEDLDAAGHFQISLEAVLEVEPDLVLGLPDGLTREAFGDAGVPVLVEPTYCPEGAPEPTFATIVDQVRRYGGVFGTAQAAEGAVQALDARVDELLATAGELPQRTVAVLFPTVGGGAGYAYGNRSMAHPQVEAANLTNVFGDVDERVFEVTVEELLDRDPDVLVLLHVDGDPGPVEAEIRGLPGADGLAAVRDDEVHVQLFHFTEPPTPLSIDGLERLVARFGGAG